MKYGFVIDNRKCIGCHACTVACKSEHDVPLGVNRTWVKQTEKGEFPNTRRLFSVLRCNHCTDAPCVEICPVTALYTRDDGIVDFNNDRCIGCKSCMQACPYDALYIDPETHTAAKCNYCAHRVDIGLEPACVNVCPEHAIISGDMDNPETEIARTIAGEQVTVRKPEKGTLPNVFYIDGDHVSLNPSSTERSSEYMWNSQSMGVGHYAKYAEKRAQQNDPLEMTDQLAEQKVPQDQVSFDVSDQEIPKKSVEVLMQKGNSKRVYDTPDKGILWGWEVSAYLLTKGIAAGVVLVTFLVSIFQWAEITREIMMYSAIIGLVFLTLTGILLVKDLDKPLRFFYVLLRPQWKSWLVKGGYSITVFGGFLTLWLISLLLNWNSIMIFALWGSALSAVIVAIYTAFLFAQARGRDFWQSPTLPFHMLTHSIMGGASAILILAAITPIGSDLLEVTLKILLIALTVNFAIMMLELTIKHPTMDSKKVVDMIMKGMYAKKFWGGSVFLGIILPFGLLLFIDPGLSYLAGLLVIIGIEVTEKIWVEAPQRIPLT